MKIAILTQPLTNNYGGILQNYAMQEVLRRRGHEVTTLDIHRPFEGVTVNAHFMLSLVKRFIQKYILRDETIVFVNPFNLRRFYDEPQRFSRRFMAENLSLVPLGVYKLTEKDDKYDGYVVGSDQVWRPYMAANLENFYLDFVKNPNAKRIAYAASFGTDNWESDEKSTATLKELAQKFDAISVREQSGVGLCKQYLDVDATFILDPTMLLDAEDYRKLYDKHPENDFDGDYIATYILDKSPEIQSMISEVSKRLNLPVKRLGKVTAAGFDSIESWLQGIDNARYVITDSFHGSVFSTLFEKQFVALGNEKRGTTRFNSLFNQFGMPNRLARATEDVIKSLQTPIDYSKVHETLEAKRKLSNQFLDENLKH